MLNISSSTCIIYGKLFDVATSLAYILELNINDC